MTALDDHARLLAVCGRWQRLYEDKLAEVERLRVENARLAAVVVKYSDHLQGCNANWRGTLDPDARCRCGYDEAIESVRVAAAATTGDAEPATELTGENLRDSGMRQSGGVADGAQ